MRISRQTAGARDVPPGRLSETYRGAAVSECGTAGGREHTGHPRTGYQLRLRITRRDGSHDEARSGPAARRMRSAPQRGWLALISPTKGAWYVVGRPAARDRHRQKSRHPNRCHRRTVSGWIRLTAERTVDVANAPMIHRCPGDQRTRLPRRRHVAATNCCRRTSFSATRAARRRSIPNTNRAKAPSIPTTLSVEASRPCGRFDSYPRPTTTRMEKVASTAP